MKKWEHIYTPEKKDRDIIRAFCRAIGLYYEISEAGAGYMIAIENPAPIYPLLAVLGF